MNDASAFISAAIAPTNRSLAALRRLTRPRPADAERCELCGLELAPRHDHLVEPPTRKLLCACPACALLFCSDGNTKYRRVPRDARFLGGFEISDGDWAGLMIPINMAFFFYSSPAQKMVAMYPSPAGPVESLLILDAWQDIARDHPALANLQPDVEALLLNRLGASRGYAAHESYLAPIDQCYRLVGLLRMHWRGLSGGTEVWNEVRRFFADLRRQAKPLPEPHHA
jgi:hypothetical protein